MDAGMIPMETQVMMQEVLTDGMAFCALMWAQLHETVEAVLVVLVKWTVFGFEEQRRENAKPPENKENAKMRAKTMQTLRLRNSLEWNMKTAHAKKYTDKGC